MPFDNLHDQIDQSQTRTADTDYELIEEDEDIWQGQVDQIQAFCNEHARKLDDDTVLEEGLKKVARLSFELANASEREGEQELIVTRLIEGLERKMAEIRSEVAGLEGEDERQRQAEETLHPKTDEEGPIPFGATEEMRTEFDDLMSEMETDDQRRAFLGDLIDGLTTEQEPINLSKQQQLRIEQLKIVTVLFQSMVRELENSSTTNFFSGLSESEKLNLIGRYNEIIEDVLPRATTEIILNPEASLETIEPEMVGRIREGTRISGDQNLISVLMATLRSVDRDNMMINLVDVQSMADLQQQRAQVMTFLQSCKQYEGVRNIAEEALAEEIAGAKKKVDFLTKQQIEDEAGEYVRKQGDKYREDWKEQGMTDAQIDKWLEDMKKTKIDHDLTVVALKKFTFTPSTDVPPEKQQIWEIYNEVFDPQDEYLNMVEDNFDTVLREVLINAPLIVVSGGIASAGRSMASGVLSIAARNLIAGTRIAAYASRAYTASKFVRGAVYVGGLVAGGATEGFLFEAAHSGMAKTIGLEEKWLFELERDEALGRVFWSSVSLGAFHGVGKLAEGLGKQIDTQLAKQVLKFKGVANPEDFKAAINIVANEISNHAARKVIQALVISGNMEAATMLLLAAVQEGYYNGDLEGFFENKGEHIFHAYMAVASLKTSGAATGKIMGRSTAPKRKKEKIPERTDSNQRVQSSSEAADSASRTEIHESTMYLTPEGTVSVLGREGENFVVTFNNGTGIQRIPVRELQRIVDSVSAERQQAFRAQEVVESLPQGRTKMASVPGVGPTTEAEVQRTYQQLGYEEIILPPTQKPAEFDRAAALRDIAADTPVNTNGNREQIAVRWMHEIKSNLTPQERALPREAQEQLVRSRLYGKMRQMDNLAALSSAVIESYLKVNPDATYQQIIDSCFPPEESQQFLPKVLRQRIKQDILTMVERRQAIVKHTAGRTPAQIVEHLFGFTPSGPIRVFRGPTSLYIDFAFPVDYVRATRDHLKTTEISDPAFQNELTMLEGGLAIDKMPSMPELNGAVTLGKNSIGRGDFTEVLVHEGEHQVHRVLGMEGDRAAAEVAAARGHRKSPIRSVKDATAYLAEADLNFLPYSQTEILAYLIGGSGPEKTIASLTRSSRKDYRYSEEYRQFCKDQLERLNPGLGEDLIDTPLSQADRLYRLQITAYTRLADALLFDSRAYGLDGARATPHQLAATPIRHWPKLFKGQWGQVVEKYVLPEAKKMITLEKLKEVIEGGRPVDELLFELNYLEENFGITREHLGVTADKASPFKIAKFLFLKGISVQRPLIICEHLRVLVEAGFITPEQAQGTVDYLRDLDSFKKLGGQMDLSDTRVAEAVRNQLFPDLFSTEQLFVDNSASESIVPGERFSFTPGEGSLVEGIVLDYADGGNIVFWGRIINRGAGGAYQRFMVSKSYLEGLKAGHKEKLIMEAIRKPLESEAQRQELASQIQSSQETGGGSNPEHAVLYGKICADLLSAADISYETFRSRLDFYYDKGLRQAITEGMDRDHAGSMLISDMFHSIINQIAFEKSFEKNKEGIKDLLETSIEAFARYRQNPTEEAFYTKQSLGKALSDFRDVATIESSLTPEDTIRAPQKTILSIIYNFYSNAAGVAKEVYGNSDNFDLTYRASREGDKITVSVYDNLPGFSAEQLSGLFDGQIESTREYGHGTGLNRIARQMEMIGGEIASYHLVEEGGAQVWKRKVPGSPPETVPAPEGMPEGTTKFFVLEFPAEPIANQGEVAGN